jgi:hypothetical protein
LGATIVDLSTWCGLEVSAIEVDFEYLGYEIHGTRYEKHVQLGTIVARTQRPLTARFHRSLHMQNVVKAGEGATGVDFKLPRKADFRNCLLGIAPKLMK